jgi:competence protein ComEA
MARRLALTVLYLLALAPALERGLAGRPTPRPVACVPSGRGEPPWHWLGCEQDPGPRRDLNGQERVLAGVPIDPNVATPEDLAGVPGLSPRLAMEVVRHRIKRGPFSSLDDLRGVRGIGPARLGRARRFLAIGR